MSVPPAPSENNLLMWPFRAGWPLKKNLNWEISGDSF